MIIEKILRKMGISFTSVTQFQNAEDGEFYNAWKIIADGKTMVLKRAKGHEPDTYQTFFSVPCTYAPRLYGTARYEDADYLLIEYIPGDDLRRCDRERLTVVLDSLIAMQRDWWEHPAPGKGFHYAQSLPGRENRRNFLKDPQLEAAYDAFLRGYSTVPRTLCHDDLLPFNVICNGGRAVFIDWEYGGILPYLTSLVRLIAHGEDTEDAFFYMTETDKAFAAAYYYDNFVGEMGISYDNYRRSLGLFLFYEYCEWVYVGNKYNDTTMPRYRSYFQKAKQLAAELGY